jgi:hypothetical protein
VHIHIPKPLHGWRAFVGEVGVIVLGVLIALSAEQLVEMLHWREQVRHGRTDLAQSYAEIRSVKRERQLTSPCLARRLEGIAVVIDQASGTGRLPPIGDIGQPRMRTLAEPIWPGLVATGTAAHFPRDEASRYTDIAKYVDSLTADQRREAEAWTRLYSIVGPGRSIGPTELGTIRAALGQALFEARIMKLSSHLVTNMITTTPLDTKNWVDHKLVGFDPRRTDRLFQQTPCRPILPPPPHYGQAPLEAVDLKESDRLFAAHRE